MSAKRVLVVQNYEKTALGALGKALDESGAIVETVMAHLGEALPADATNHDALVVLGGGQNALADHHSPHFPQLLELIREFESRDKAILGICLGSQLMARAFGGTNQIGGATEFGWKTVTPTPAAKSDPVLGGLPESFPVFQWHDDTFGPPEGVASLASSADVANQAFRIGRASYAFQFHFEADREHVEAWNADFTDVLTSGKPGWLEGRHRAEAAEHGAAADAAGLAISRAWIATI